MSEGKSMTPDRKITGSDEAWDRRELGADSNFVVVADDTDDDAIDAALDLQPISIRLQKSLIEDFKMIAQLNDIGYQPLMRQVLARFADSEKKRILRQVVSDTLRRRKEDDAEDAQSKTGTHG
ncbi:hypothetical protein [Thiocystis violascens]|nr:hypothetical protein [Thiocystis violascens]